MQEHSADGEVVCADEYDQLRYFLGGGLGCGTDENPACPSGQPVGGSDAMLVIDDTAVPKKDTHSVSVAPQFASALGKTTNCQTLLSLARGEVPVMPALQLFLSKSWTCNRARLK